MVLVVVAAVLRTRGVTAEALDDGGSYAVVIATDGAWSWSVLDGVERLVRRLDVVTGALRLLVLVCGDGDPSRWWFALLRRDVALGLLVLGGR